MARDRARDPGAGGLYSVPPGAVRTEYSCMAGAEDTGDAAVEREGEKTTGGSNILAWSLHGVGGVGGAASRSKFPPVLGVSTNFASKKERSGAATGIHWSLGRGQGGGRELEKLGRLRVLPEYQAFCSLLQGPRSVQLNLTSPLPSCSINLIIKQQPRTPSTLRTGLGCSLSDKRCPNCAGSTSARHTRCLLFLGRRVSSRDQNGDERASRVVVWLLACVQFLTQAEYTDIRRMADSTMASPAAQPSAM